MRYNSVIRFYSEGNKKYNFQTSKSESSPKLLLEVMGNVIDVGIQTSHEVLGTIKQQFKTIILREPIDFKWGYLTIDDSPKKYRLRTAVKPLKNYTLIVGEDVG